MLEIPFNSLLIRSSIAVCAVSDVILYAMAMPVWCKIYQILMCRLDPREIIADNRF